MTGSTVADPGERLMAKKKAGRPQDQSGRPDHPVRVDADLIDKIEIVLRWKRKKTGRRLSTADYLSPVIRPVIESDYAQALEDEYREFRDQSKKKP